MLTVVSYAVLAVAAHVQVGARARTVLLLPQADEMRIKGDRDSGIIQEESNLRTLKSAKPGEQRTFDTILEDAI